MYKHIILGIGLSFGLTSCGGSSSKKDKKSEVKEETLDCWLGAIPSKCDIAASYNKAKTLALEFKHPLVRSNFGYKETLAYNDSIFALLDPLKEDLVKIKSIIGENSYNVYFGNIEKQKDTSKEYQNKFDVISQITLTSKMLSFNPKYQDRDIAYVLENKSNSKLERVDVINTFYDKNGNVLFVDDEGVIGSYDFTPNTKGNFIPENYKGKKTNPILAISDVKTLKAIHTVETKIIDVIFK